MNFDRQNLTSIEDFFVWLRDTVAKDTALHTAAETYLAESKKDRVYDKDAPFLSIVMRTQGKRPEMLAEVLLCLFGQSNTDFELLLMGHNLNEAQNETVTQIIADLPAALREKTRLIHVAGGTRTTPLNRGFDEARGRYIAILDDDDLVFENWVEAFYELSLKEDGKILHSYAVKQDWQTVGGDLPDSPCAVGKHDDCYCADFDFFKQLTINSCPLCTLAFPAYVFKNLGVRFDESLTTTEDWDYLMRAVLFTGVADTDQITFLYRMWTNAENSATLHNRTEWDKNYQKIVDQFLDTPIVMPRQSLKGVIDTAVVRAGEKEMACMAEMLRESELYYDFGEAGMVNSRLLKPICERDAQTDACTLHFPQVGRLEERVKTLRFDPRHAGLITVTDFELRVTEKNGTVTAYTLADMQTNGVRMDGRVVYLLDDPQLFVTFDDPKDLQDLSVHCYYAPEISNEDRGTLIYRPLTFMQRVVRKLRHIKGRLLGK